MEQKATDMGIREVRVIVIVAGLVVLLGIGKLFVPEAESEPPVEVPDATQNVTTRPIHISAPVSRAAVPSTFKVSVTNVPRDQDALVITLGDRNLQHAIGCVLSPSAGTVVVACDVGRVTGRIKICAQVYDPTHTICADNDQLLLTVRAAKPRDG